jgi:hypothetical protein
MTINTGWLTALPPSITTGRLAEVVRPWATAVRKIFAVVIAAALTAAPSPAVAISDSDLAFHWAPVHYQDTDDTDADADYLSPIDFDGEWNTLNNWESQEGPAGRLTGAVYYSVVETSTHWFIVYAFYHPRDWCDGGFRCTEHENDLEGVLLAVRKEGTHGSLEAMVSVFHRDFYSYIPPGGSYGSGGESIDGTIVLTSHEGTPDRPTTFQEAKGHGAKAWNGREFPGGDGVIYLPARGSSEVPENGNDRSVNYRLVNIFDAGGLWSRRSNPETFAGSGTFRGDNGTDNAAHAPWRWDDQDDGSELPGGELATDPAKLVAIYFSNLGPFSRDYVRNGYR